MFGERIKKNTGAKKAPGKNSDLLNKLSSKLSSVKDSVTGEYCKYKEERAELREYKRSLKRHRKKRIAEYESEVLLKREKEKISSGGKKSSENKFNLDKFKVRIGD